MQPPPPLNPRRANDTKPDYPAIMNQEDLSKIVNKFDPTNAKYQQYREQINKQALDIFLKMMQSTDANSDLETQFFIDKILKTMPRNRFEVPILTRQQIVRRGEPVMVWRASVDTNTKDQREKPQILKLVIFKSPSSRSKTELDVLQTPAYWRDRYKQDGDRNDSEFMTAVYQICIYNAFDWDLRREYNQSQLYTIVPAEYAEYSEKLVEIVKQMDAMYGGIDTDAPAFDLLTTVPLRVQIINSLSNDDVVTLLATQLLETANATAPEALRKYTTPAEKMQVLSRLVKTFIGPKNLGSILAAPQYYYWWSRVVHLRSIPQFGNANVNNTTTAFEMYTPTVLQNKFKSFEIFRPEATAQDINERRLVGVLTKGYNSCLAQHIARCAGLEGAENPASCTKLPQQCLAPMELLNPYPHMLKTMSTSNAKLMTILASVLNRKVEFPDLDVVPSLVPSQERAVVLEVLNPLTRDHALQTNPRARRYMDSETGNVKTLKGVNEQMTAFKKSEAIETAVILSDARIGYADAIEFKEHTGGKFKDMVAPVAKLRQVAVPHEWAEMRERTPQSFPLTGALNSLEDMIAAETAKAIKGKPRQGDAAGVFMQRASGGGGGGAKQRESFEVRNALVVNKEAEAAAKVAREEARLEGFGGRRRNALQPLVWNRGGGGGAEPALVSMFDSDQSTIDDATDFGLGTGKRVLEDDDVKKQILHRDDIAVYDAADAVNRAYNEMWDAKDAYQKTNGTNAALQVKKELRDKVTQKKRLYVDAYNRLVVALNNPAFNGAKREELMINIKFATLPNRF